MDITHARVVAPAGVKLVLVFVNHRGVEIINISIRRRSAVPIIYSRNCTHRYRHSYGYDFAGGAVRRPHVSWRRAIASAKLPVQHCVSHATRRPRDCYVVFPVNRISGQRQYMLIDMLMLTSTRKLDIWPEITSNTICTHAAG